jgi:hypothetical protein
MRAVRRSTGALQAPLQILLACETLASMNAGLRSLRTRGFLIALGVGVLWCLIRPQLAWFVSGGVAIAIYLAIRPELQRRGVRFTEMLLLVIALAVLAACGGESASPRYADAIELPALLEVSATYSATQSSIVVKADITIPESVLNDQATADLLPPDIKQSLDVHALVTAVSGGLEADDWAVRITSEGMHATRRHPESVRLKAFLPGTAESAVAVGLPGSLHLASRSSRQPLASNQPTFGEPPPGQRPTTDDRDRSVGSESHTAGSGEPFPIEFSLAEHSRVVLTTPRLMVIATKPASESAPAPDGNEQRTVGLDSATRTVTLETRSKLFRNDMLAPATSLTFWSPFKWLLGLLMVMASEGARTELKRLIRGWSGTAVRSSSAKAKDAGRKRKDTGKKRRKG